MEGYKPAKKGVALIALAVSAVLVIAFALLLRVDMRAPKTLDPAKWQQAVPTGFRCDFTAETQGGALTLRGWAAVEGERLLTVENYAVLYNTATGEYLRLPTAMEFDSRATEAIGGDIVYDRGGFVSVTPLKYLGGDLSVYEVCFAYGAGDHSFLAHTGFTLAEGGGSL